MEELVFTSSFASNNEYRLLCIDCSQIDKNSKVDNNNNNNSGSSNSSLDNVRQMVERIKQLCKPVQQKQKECKVKTEQEEQKEQQEQMLLEKRKKESNSEKSLVLVLRNGRHVIVHDALSTCLVKRLEYSNNLLITLSQISQKQENKEHELEHVENQHREKQHNPFTVDATNRVNDNNNTNSSYNVAERPKYSDHDHLHENKEHPCHQTSQEQCQEELLLLEEEEKQEKEQEETSKQNILYKIMSQVNSIYTCTNLPQIALGNICNTYNKPFARWQCFVFNTLEHSLVSVEELRLITLLEEQENRESKSVINSIDSNVLETEVKSPLRYVNANSHSNNVNEDHREEGLESSKVHNNELTTKVNTNYKKNIEVLSEFDELELNSENKRCKVLERCEHYTFYDLIKKIPCSPAELSETLTNMGAIIIVADSHNSNNNNNNSNNNTNNDNNIRNKSFSKDYIYLLQPAEEYIALHSVLKIFESILLQSSINNECDAIRVDENDSDDDVIVVANNNGNGRISNSRKRQRSDNNDSNNSNNNNNNNNVNVEDDNENV